jgi:hypothetical protein
MDFIDSIPFLTMTKYSLRFTFTPRKSDELLIGTLVLLRDDAETNAYQATSSIAGRQYWESWELRGGLIPPRADYTVTLSPIPMPSVRGVEGNFYQILPFECPTKGATRGDFGIHRDANVPGSMGCIVLPTKRGWTAFQQDCKLIASQGVKTLPLEIDYNK